MPRLSITISDAMHLRLSSLATQNKESMSNIINQLIKLGMKQLEEGNTVMQPIEKHCQQLIIQMNALVKNLSAEILKFDQEDFEQLRQATAIKYYELIVNAQSS